MWRAVLLRSEGTLVSTFMAPACRTASMTSSATISAVLDGQVGGVCVRARACVRACARACARLCARAHMYTLECIRREEKWARALRLFLCAVS